MEIVNFSQLKFFTILNQAGINLVSIERVDNINHFLLGGFLSAIYSFGTESLNEQMAQFTMEGKGIRMDSIVINSRDNNSKYESYKKSISFSIFIATLAIIISIIFLPFGSIKSPDQNIFPLGSPLYAVGTVVSITLAALFALVQSFYKLLMSEFD